VTCLQRNLSYRVLDSPSFEVLISSYYVGFKMPGLNKNFLWPIGSLFLDEIEKLVKYQIFTGQFVKNHEHIGLKSRVQ